MQNSLHAYIELDSNADRQRKVAVVKPTQSLHKAYTKPTQSLHKAYTKPTQFLHKAYINPT